MATNEVLQAIPHRPPFLFIDEILQQDDKQLVAKKHVDGSEDFFQGHYPGNPIMPGVLISEAVFQAGAVFLSKLYADKMNSDSDQVPVLTKINGARFKNAVRPGDDLYITVKYKEHVGKFVFLDGSVSNGNNQKVMTVSFSVAVNKIEPNQS